MPLLKKLPIPTTTPRTQQQKPTSTKLRSGHKHGALFHFHTEIIGDRIFLKDALGNTIKKLDINWNDSMTEKEKQQAIVDATRQLREVASDLFLNFDGDTLQIGGFLFN